MAAKNIYFFMPNCTVCVIFRANEYKMAENALSHMLLKLIINDFLGHFMLHQEQDYMLSGAC